MKLTTGAPAQAASRKTMEAPTYLQIEAIQRFENSRRLAQIMYVWRRVVRAAQHLLPFEPIHARLPNRNGLHRGVQEIPLRQIVGSVGRAAEFDRDFRPLRNGHRERWVNIRLLHATIGWEPIIVHQVGNLYFVEDGHHRVSVARDMGLDVIEASVIAYPLPLRFRPTDSLAVVLARIDAHGVGDPASPAGAPPALANCAVPGG
jgi:hypothetical protein